MKQRELADSSPGVCDDDPSPNSVEQVVFSQRDCHEMNPDSTCKLDSSSSKSSSISPEEPINFLQDFESDDEVNLFDEEYYNYCYSSEEQYTDSEESDDNHEEIIDPLIDERNTDIEAAFIHQEICHSEDNDSCITDVSDKQKNDNKYSKSVMLRTFLILALKLRKHLDNEVITLITQLIDAMTDVPLLFTSTFHFKTIVNQYTVPIQIHHFCPKCKIYIGKELQDADDNIITGIDDNQQILHCNQCRVDIIVKENRRLGNIFVYLPLTQQLSEFCERHHKNLLYPKNRKKQCSYAIEDIFDGHRYKNSCLYDLPEEMVSINFSIDGTPLFKSSLTSITPILCTINELHPQQRKHNIFLVSVYLGSKKPIMNEYIKPFVEEAKLLSDTGIDYNFEGVIYHKKCRVLLGVCDSVERPELRGSKTFRGCYGCGLCKHPGEERAKDAGHVRIYPISDDGNAYGEGLRSHEETLDHIRNAEKGMKYRSTLCDIPYFDIITNLDVDWMHCVALGVCRQFLKLWFDSMYHEKEYYLGNDVTAIDEVLLSFKPSMDISRTPRKMSKDQLHLKAHELVIWLLFYSLPVLKLFLPNKFVKHWGLLVEGVSILLKTSIMESEVYNSQRCLFNFVKEIEGLYGKEHLSFNVHLLTHLPQSVLNWGPLWTHSAFCYENFHQFLKKLVKSSNAADLQILESFRSQMAFYKLKNLYEEQLTLRQFKLLQKLTNEKKKPQASFSVGNIGLVGKAISKNELSADHFLALQRIHVNVDEKSEFQYYKRALINNESIHSKQYIKVMKRNSYTVLLANDEIFEIESFLIVNVNNDTKCFALGKYLIKQKNTLFPGIKLEHLYFVKYYDHLAAIEAKNIDEKVTILKIENDPILVVCKHPNKYEMLT